MLASSRNVTERRRLAHLSLAAVLSFAVVASAVLYRFPPEAYSFYPLCPIREYLHLQCPGCGATRALAALAHGHFVEAIHWNALIIGLVLPVAAGYGLLSYARAVGGNSFRWPHLPKPAVYAGFGVMMAFTVMRNL